MNESTCGSLMSTVVAQFMPYFDAGKVSVQDTRKFVAHCVEATSQWGGNIEEVFSLIPDRCTCCFQKKNPTQLIRWDALDHCAEGSPMRRQAEISYNNCFGEEMTGSRVCLDCLETLPPDGPEDIYEDAV